MGGVIVRHNGEAAKDGQAKVGRARCLTGP